VHTEGACNDESARKRNATKKGSKKVNGECGEIHQLLKEEQDLKKHSFQNI
jgi:hypothetical protein